MNDALKSWVVSVNMGLGHLRAVYPLQDIAFQGILLIGEDATSDQNEKKLWKNIRETYEFLSRVKKIPIIGAILFNFLDSVQTIPPLYPLRDLSKPPFQTQLIYSYIKKGVGKLLMEKVKDNPLPYISSYPVSALIPDFYGYHRNYCIICDAEISRAWVAKDPAKSKINYLVPCGRSVQRLKQYGVPDDRIFLTGFPLPKSALGSENLELLLNDVGQRLNILDPNDRFWPLHRVNVEFFLGKENIVFRKERVLSITYAVGGAGAYKEIGIQIAKSLRSKILNGEVKLNLVAAVRKEVYNYYIESLKELDIPDNLVYILYSPDKMDYFEKFAQLMRVTDIIWSKPSELSFYVGLGIPFVMTEPLGSQEKFNKNWLMEIQAGIPQEDPNYTHEWLFDLLNYGRLAEAAWDGFLKARKFGTYKIAEILQTGVMSRETSPLRR